MFQKCLKEMFPIEAGEIDAKDRTIPTLPGNALIEQLRFSKTFCCSSVVFTIIEETPVAWYLYLEKRKEKRLALLQQIIKKKKKVNSKLMKYLYLLSSQCNACYCEIGQNTFYLFHFTHLAFSLLQFSLKLEAYQDEQRMSSTVFG